MRGKLQDMEMQDTLLFWDLFIEYLLNMEFLSGTDQGIGDVVVVEPQEILNFMNFVGYSNR